MASDTITKKGTLEALSIRNTQQPTWHTKFFVLYGKSDSNRARLDWYTSESDFRTSPASHKTIYVEGIEKIELYKENGRSHTFQICTLHRKEPFQYAAESKSEAKDWINSIARLKEEQGRRPSGKEPRQGNMGDDVYVNELVVPGEQPREYLVTITDTQLSKKCNLTQGYVLRVYSKYVAIANPRQKDNIFVWPFNHIRRFGRTVKSFTFEPGRRSATGEGLLSFRTDSGEEIFQTFASCGKQPVEDARRSTIPPILPDKQLGEGYCDLVKTRNAHREGMPLPKQPSQDSPPNPSLSNRPRPPVPAGVKPAPPARAVSNPDDVNDQHYEVAGPNMQKQTQQQLKSGGGARPTVAPLSDTYSDITERPSHINVEYDEPEAYGTSEAVPGSVPKPAAGAATTAATESKMSDMVAQRNRQRFSGSANLVTDDDVDYDEISWNKHQVPQTPEPDPDEADYSNVNEGETTIEEATYSAIQ